MTKQALATKKEEQLPLVFDPMNMESMAGAGAETATQEDFAIPFITVAEGLSPQLNKGESKYIKGLAIGDLFNTVTGEIFTNEDGGCTVIPCKFERKFLEFNLREKGGGLVAIHDSYDFSTTVRDDKNRDITDAGTQIVDARSFYCMVQGKDGWFPAIISMKSTQAKKAKQWMSMISSIQLPRADGKGTFTPPMFSHTYVLTTASETNAKGTWNGYVIAKGEALTVGDERFQRAVEFYKSLSAGEVKVDYSGAGGDAHEEETVPMQ